MFGLYQDSYKEILTILQKYDNISKVVIYGSRAKGNYREGSDIDLTLFGDIEYEQLIKLKLDFEDSFIPYLIDLSLFKDIESEILKEHINRVGKIFYQKTEINKT